MNTFPFTPMSRMDDIVGSERRPLLHDSNSFVMSRRRNPPTVWWKWTIGVLSVTCVCASVVAVSINGFKNPKSVTIELPKETPVDNGQQHSNLKMAYTAMGKVSLPKPDWADKDKPDKPDWPDKDKPDKPDWPDKDKPDKPDWPDKDWPDKPEKPDWPDKDWPDKPDKPDWPDKDWPDKPDKPDWPDKPEKDDAATKKLNDEIQKNISYAYQKANAKYASHYLFGEEPPVPKPGDDDNKTAQAYAEYNAKMQEKFAKAFMGGSFKIPFLKDDDDKTTTEKPVLKNGYASMADPKSYAKSYAKQYQDINNKWAKKYLVGGDRSKGVSGESQSQNGLKVTNNEKVMAEVIKDRNDRYRKRHGGSKSGTLKSGGFESWSSQMETQKKYADMNRAMNEKYMKKYGALKSGTPGSGGGVPGDPTSYTEYNKKINEKFAKSYTGGASLPDYTTGGGASSYADYNAKINENFANKFMGGVTSMGKGSSYVEKNKEINDKFMNKYTGIDKPLLKSTDDESSDPSRSYFEKHRETNNKYRMTNGGVTIPDTPSKDYSEFAEKYSDYAKEYKPKKSNPGSGNLYLTHDELDEKIKKIYIDAKEKIQVLLDEKGKTHYKKELEEYVLKEGKKEEDVFKEATMSMFERAMEHGSAKLQKRMALEKNLRQKGIELKANSAAASHQRFTSCKPRALKLAKRAVIKEGASELLKEELNLLSNQVEEFLPLLEKMGQEIFNAEDGTEDGRCWKEKPYRIVDGACNNVQQPEWGSAFSPYRRLLPAEYDDGISKPRLGSSGKPLPSARQISATLYNENRKGDSKATLMSSFWGLLVDHDLTNTAGSKSSDGKPITCCHDEVLKNVSYQHPECMAIQVSTVDSFFSPLNITCQEFVRSAPANYKRLGPRDQMNQLTSYLDGSVIYGSSADETQELRTHQDGQIKVSMIHGLPMLPVGTNPLSTCGNPAIQQYCFKSGDVRVNMDVELMTMHTLLHREHNRVANRLKAINPTWNDERLFQEAKRVTVAEFQHLTYNEYLPLLIGKSNVKKYGLEITKGGEYYDGYDSETDATISNIFAAGAFRFGHTQIKSFIELSNSKYKSVEKRILRKTFFNPETLYEIGVDPHVKGMMIEQANTVDNHVSCELRNHLFEPKDGMFGTDLVGITVQRGRDHGLPPYAKWRKFCNLSPVNNWTDMERIAGKEKTEMLRNTYDSVKDIDFVVGAESESKVPGGLLGPTHVCLIAEQFARLRKGDRYWFENTFPAPFTKEQLVEIKKSTIARLLCDNSDSMEFVPLRPFEKISKKNDFVKCSDIPEVNLATFYEDPKNRLPSSQYKP